MDHLTSSLPNKIMLFYNKCYKMYLQMTRSVCMNLSFLALFFVGIITIYAIAFTLIIKLLGRKFKDKSNK